MQPLYSLQRVRPSIVLASSPTSIRTARLPAYLQGLIRNRLALSPSCQGRERLLYATISKIHKKCKGKVKAHEEERRRSRCRSRSRCKHLLEWRVTFPTWAAEMSHKCADFADVDVKLSVSLRHLFLRGWCHRRWCHRHWCYRLWFHGYWYHTDIKGVYHRCLYCKDWFYRYWSHTDITDWEADHAGWRHRGDAADTVIADSTLSDGVSVPTNFPECMPTNFASQIYCKATSALIPLPR